MAEGAGFGFINKRVRIVAVAAAGDDAGFAKVIGLSNERRENKNGEGDY